MNQQKALCATGESTIVIFFLKSNIIVSKCAEKMD